MNFIPPADGDVSIVETEHSPESSSSPFGTASATPFFRAFSAWHELKNLVAELAFPSWLEDERSGVVYINRCEGTRIHLDQRTVQDIRLTLSTRTTQEPVCVRDERGQWLELNIVSHLIPVVTDDAAFGTPVALYVACPVGQEQQRDRSIIAALLTRLLGTSVSSSLSSLTPQQRIIYRLLMSDQSYKEIAAQLGVAHATIRVQIAAMRKRLGPEMIPLLRRDTAC